MAELKEQIAQQLHSAQWQYTYVLMATAASCIALCVQRTTGLPLSWNQVPLGLAVLCWGASFWFGCRNRALFSSMLYANFDFLNLSDGTHRQQPARPEMVRPAMVSISDAAQHNSSSANRYAKRQFAFLIAGALLFLCWHVFEMAAKQSFP